MRGHSPYGKHGAGCLLQFVRVESSVLILVRVTFFLCLWLFRVPKSSLLLFSR